MLKEEVGGGQLVVCKGVALRLGRFYGDGGAIYLRDMVRCVFRGNKPLKERDDEASSVFR